MPAYICSECKKPAYVTVMDIGVENGDYRKMLVSECCEAKLFYDKQCLQPVTFTCWHDDCEADNADDQYSNLNE